MPFAKRGDDFYLKAFGLICQVPLAFCVVSCYTALTICYREAVLLQQKPYAFFDFDGTLIKGDSIVRFCLYAYRKGLCSLRQLLHAGVMGVLYHCRFTSAEKSKQAALAFLAGRPRREVDRIAKDFCLSELIPNLYPEGVEAIRRHRREGCEVWLVSASTVFYLQPLVRYLHLTRLIGTRMHVDGQGRYSGLIDGHNCRGVEKPLRIEEVLSARGEMVDYAASYAYGDTAGDIPMLMLCEHKMAVNPRRKLRRGLRGADGVQTVRWGKTKPSKNSRPAR